MGTTVHRSGRAVVPTLPRAALRVVRAELLGFRRNWRGYVVSSLGNPIAYLAAMGIGLGQLVDGPSSPGVGLPYLTFVASGLMAASAMQNGFGEGAWPVMAGLKWRRHYEAMMTTTLRPRDLLAGRLAWGAVNLAGNLVAFAGVAVALGALEVLPAVVAIGPALLTGLAFQACMTALTATVEREVWLSNVYRFIVMPLFLFSGTFFPISQLPGLLQGLAVVTPLYHGVELTRKVALGPQAAAVVGDVPVLVHVLVLVCMVGAGAVMGSATLTRRLHR